MFIAWTEASRLKTDLNNHARYKAEEPTNTLGMSSYLAFIDSMMRVNYPVRAFGLELLFLGYCFKNICSDVKKK